MTNASRMKNNIKYIEQSRRSSKPCEWGGLNHTAISRSWTMRVGRVEPFCDLTLLDHVSGGGGGGGGGVVSFMFEQHAISHSWKIREKLKKYSRSGKTITCEFRELGFGFLIDKVGICDDVMLRDTGGIR